MTNVSRKALIEKLSEIVDSPFDPDSIVSLYHDVCNGGLSESEGEADREFWRSAMQDQAKEYLESVQSLRAENERLRTALEWYAWGTDEKMFWETYEVVNDGGAKARKALEGSTSEKVEIDLRPLLETAREAISALASEGKTEREQLQGWIDSITKEARQYLRERNEARHALEKAERANAELRDALGFQHLLDKIKRPKVQPSTSEIAVQHIARTIDEWHEDKGTVLWWAFPIEEPPYVGSPLADDWPGYHTHWTAIPIPGIKDGREETE